MSKTKTIVIDGHKLAEEKERELRKKVIELEKVKRRPGLAVLVMEDDKSGQLYMNLKKKSAEKLGVNFYNYQFSDLEAEKIIEVIEFLNKDNDIHGIVMQRPGLSWGRKRGMKREAFENWWNQVVEKIELVKDVDGLREKSEFTLAAVKAVLYLKEEIKGKVVVVGSKGLMGRRLMEFLAKNPKLKVVGVDIGDDLKKELKLADTVITATGKHKLIKGEMVKNKVVVIDMGWPKGDVEFDTVSKKAKVITPVPGGIGPLTVVSLLENLIDSLL